MATESKPKNKPDNLPEEAFYDLPPESFWVATADEQDWFNQYAVMQRKTSLKLGFNRHIPHRSDGVSNRKPARTSVFGLPKARRSFGTDKNPSEKKPSRPLFRSRSEPGGKPPAVQVSDPGSPRVSCTGRIGSRSHDGKKTGFTKLFSSLFGAGSGKSRPRKGGHGGAR